MQTAVIFDVFGTLIRIQEKRNPYLQLLRYARTQGVSPCSDRIQMFMTRELDWEETAEALGVRAGYVKLHGLARLLDEELASMALYPDAAEAIAMLREAGVRIGLCSNLARATAQLYESCYQGWMPTGLATKSAR